MAITRGLAATAMLAGLALGLAGPATAQYQMSGHYTETQSDPSTGQQLPLTRDWYFTPCGDGCASAAMSPGGQAVGQAQVVNGQWTLDTTDGVGCPDGSSVPNAVAGHRAWDPNTLAGTLQETFNVPACGDPAGDKGTLNIQLRQAS